MRDELPLVLTVEEFARATRVGRGTAYEAVRTGQVRSIRLGRRVLIPRTVLLELLGEPRVDMTPEFVGGVIEPPAEPAR